MQHELSLVEHAEALLEGVKACTETQACGCPAIEGYVAALREVVQLLDTHPVGVQTKEGEDAILADREELLSRVVDRIAQFEDEAEPELDLEDEPTGVDILSILLQAVAEGRFQAIKL